ncbi:MAG: Gfo/Idh/MocA family oxidoreductase [Capsulimonadales bacterium]|nr:Gfo/Idh/MocA family oxidoreductase [Capsulimonadales bacterium]
MKRYAIVGLGSRSSLYTHALHTDFREFGTLVGFCDPNRTRMNYWNAHYARSLGVEPVPTYTPADFETMLTEQAVDTVLVTSIDRTHDDYILRAMRQGCDVITEKPMTIDAPRCQRILDTIRETGRQLVVTFNYRYALLPTRIREVLRTGVIGDILSVHFEWLLDTRHGADYFRRWHRDKRNSGGLMVHKATHHFDVVNWWLGSYPETVYGIGQLAFYGRENAEKRGVTAFYERAKGSEAARDDPFALHLDRHTRLTALYGDAEHEDGYVRDRSVFADGISIEDDMAVLVRYASGATMTYHLTAYSPWEGWRIAFNGTKGRLEAEMHQNSYISGGSGDPNTPNTPNTPNARTVPWAKEADLREEAFIRVRPHWEKPFDVEVPTATGGHGGGDERLLRDLFLPEREPDPLGRAAGPIDGAYSLLTGIAANRSFATGLPVRIADLVRFQSRF